MHAGSENGGEPYYVYQSFANIGQALIAMYSPPITHHTISCALTMLISGLNYIPPTPPNTHTSHPMDNNTKQ